MPLLRHLLLLSCGLLLSAIAQALPRPDHIVIVIAENHAYSQIIGNPDAPYINALAAKGMLLTQSYGVTHPSQPNYIALFSGDTQGIDSNACPYDLSGDNLASALLGRGFSFMSYAESMPAAGYKGCIRGAYVRKHNPVANWSNLAAYNQPFTAFPQDFNQLPSVALVIPDMNNGMHDGSIAEGDTWLAQNIDAYAQWAMTHNSLLIVTWDEDNDSEQNRIPTLLLGAMVKPGTSAQRVDHYNVLRTIEEMFGLPYLGNSATASPIADIWQALPAATSTQESCLYAWAETTYPGYLAPPQSASLSAPPYRYRYYPQSQAYLGISSDNSHLYYLGALTGNALLDLGFVADWQARAGCL